MKFHNTRADQELNFTILGKTYKVEADGEVDVDPAHVPYVISRGVALEPAKRKPVAVATTKSAKPAEPAKPSA